VVKDPWRPSVEDFAEKTGMMFSGRNDHAEKAGIMF